MALEREEENTLDYHLALAKEIIAYTQHVIKMGTTELSFNDVTDKSTRKELKQKIRRLRALYHADDPFSLEIDMALRLFERKVGMILSWQFGNCMEHVYLALDFLINETKKTSGEIFRIEGGDHVFLVIGRKLRSRIDDPMTWGKTAVICDPWAKKAYPAHEYLEKLRTYRWADGVNHTEPFDPTVHKIGMRSILDTSDFIRKQQDLKSRTRYSHGGKQLYYMDMLLDFFQEKMTFFEKACEELCDDLSKIRDEIESEQGQSNPKYRALAICIEDLNHCSTQVGDQLTHIDKFKTISPEDAAKELSRQLRSNYQLFKEARDTLGEKKSVLNEGRRFSLFNTDSYRKTVNALDKSQDKTKRYDNYIHNKKSPR